MQLCNCLFPFLGHGLTRVFFSLGNITCFGSVDWTITLYFLLDCFSAGSIPDSVVSLHKHFWQCNGKGDEESEGAAGGTDDTRATASALLPNAKFHVLVRKFLFITVIYLQKCGCTEATLCEYLKLFFFFLGAKVTFWYFPYQIRSSRSRS